MKVVSHLTDAAVLAELGHRAQRARLERNMTATQLAETAGLSVRTIERFEATGVAQLVTVVRVLRALGLIDGLDRLLPEPSVRPIEHLERGVGGRKRASHRRTPSKPVKPWVWSDQR